MTTKFPASALLMELSCYMKKMSIRTVVDWSPREANKEADNLANGVFDGFSSSMRIPIGASSLKWEIVPQALVAGRAAEERFLERPATKQISETEEEESERVRA